MQFDYQIPELSGLEPNVIDFFLNVFAGWGLKDRVAYSLVSNFIRLVDLAVDEYELGRKAILDFISSQESIRISRAYRSASHFEVCISTIKRAIEHLKAIRASQNVPQTVKDLCPRNSIVLSGSVEGRVTDMRDTVMHLEERLKTAKIAPDESIMLLAGEKEIALGEYRITYMDMVVWLKELHGIADKLAHHIETKAK